MKKSSNGSHKLFYARLTKAERLKSKSLLITILKKGQKIKTSFFAVTYLFQTISHSTLSSKTIFAISVPKKVSKKAVERNRIKRIFRHAWQSFKNSIELQIPSHLKLCIFVSVYQKILHTIHDIVEELRFCFQKMLLNLPHAEN